MSVKQRGRPAGRSGNPRTRSPRWGWAAAAVGLVLVLVCFWWAGWRSRQAEGRVDGAAAGASDPGRFHFQLEEEREAFARYAGSESCRECHEEAYEEWRRSNHGMAERLVTAELDREAFEPQRGFSHGSQETQVVWAEERAEVRTPGLSGSQETHRVDRVIGQDPLRQFLVPFPGGRWQTLEASYDPRSNQWFNVYGEEDRRPGEWGHWTGRGMNWNMMCAGCHNTRLRKNYDEAADAYHTTMVERSVGCESCHGPLKQHNEWQREFGKSARIDPTVPKLDRRRILDNCGFCHARRTDLTGDFKPGDDFFDHQDLAIVDRTDLFYPDGQVRDEDYEYASFLSSRMHFRGVICLDCHEPHSARTRLPGNWLCIRCHNGSYPDAPVIDPVAHSHHRVYGYTTNGVAVEFDLEGYDPERIEEKGGECVNCHMPQTVYMQRHWRHDHGFTIPDPLLTKEHGIPNACNRCHQDKTVEWSIKACNTWYGERMERPTRQRARWLARARAGDSQAVGPLVEMVSREDLGFWRAAAIEMLEPWVLRPEVQAALLKATADSEPLVRSRVARSLESLLAGSEAADAAGALGRLLNDPSRAVRVSAAWAMRDRLDLSQRAAGELLHGLDLNSDQPGGQMQKGAWFMSRGELRRAEGHYAKAVAWDPNSAPIRHDYAVTLSMLGRVREAIAELESACRLAPAEAEYRYKLGLAWNEAGDLAQAIVALREAVKLDPVHDRAGYNLGLALNQAGRPTEALEALRQAERAALGEPRIPYAQATILVGAGRVEEARAALARALTANPNHAESLQLLEDLSEDSGR